MLASLIFLPLLSALSHSHPLSLWENYTHVHKFSYFPVVLFLVCLGISDWNFTGTQRCLGADDFDFADVKLSLILSTCFYLQKWLQSNIIKLSFYCCLWCTERDTHSALRIPVHRLNKSKNGLYNSIVFGGEMLVIVVHKIASQSACF